MAGGLTWPAAAEFSLPADAGAVGVDGAAGGWLAAAATAGGWRFERFDAFDALVDRLADPDRVLVDVPVGLRETGRRECDAVARELLGPRHASVFAAPTRAALAVRADVEDGAEYDDAHAAASAANREADAGGLSIQAWHITDAILAVDRALDGAPLDGTVREAHPELAFAAFAGGPLAAPKSEEAGRRRRRQLLAERRPGSAPAAGAADERFLQREATLDDVLDAMALALAADGPLRSVPDDPDDGQPRIYYPAVDGFPPAETGL